ncbi:hypothetical protein CCUS01_08998 [Colletotrichum cuscutae]|uniref:Uncharacterized protein n=3 Tax=Colletotrichum acutatum species complex TaxID=2707335 RepID=A0AAI9Z043_9PEZI|nr:uncharacterized protein CCOS01_06755 [Colletotrichum costaricense]XP_060387882.1 uncharacterized protein CTAM01_01379 [Colletotrichum tamarilloi]KAI3528087.1 hypothetical protein CSPX01_16493 [Colletotrichum filicis]KAK1458744.1 hypothetical protein CCUS01_08998 [Colletotrichum cuscutae]KAK1510806.1 hypothetical protein CTAM01_01379 [Colletotrichum tamarilloi]KAK1528921.1 hypothetical protein CCOS01_06755 [Colletotrichum costaricense]
MVVLANHHYHHVSSSCFSLAPLPPFSNVTLPLLRTLAAKPQPDPTTSSTVSPAGNWGKRRQQCG